MAGTANSIITPQTPKANTAVSSTATAAAPYTSTPTNSVLLATMGANGGRVTRIRSVPRNTVTATVVLLFLSLDAGATKVLLDDILMAAYTASTTTLVPKIDWGYSETNAMPLPAGAQLYIAQTVTMTDGIATEIEWGDY